jgi:polar amino acid transport system substrate-binding protein
MFRTPRIFTLLFLTGALAVSAFAAACGDDDGGGDEATPTAAAAASPTTAAAGTPASGAIDISGVEELADGTLDIGSDIAYAPIEFLDESTNEPVGLDIDIANALAEKLGVEAKFNNSAFDGLLGALDAERYDAIVSAMTASDERKEQVDFVEYFNAGSGIIVAAGNPKGVATADDLCGLKVAVQEGTVQVDFLVGPEGEPGGQDQKCKDEGKDGIEVLKFPTDPEAVQALLSGQADAEMADFPVAAYSATQNEGKIELIPNYQIEPAPYGIALRKSSTALNDALQEAFDAIVADGTYDEILTKWSLEAGKLD